MKRLLCVFLSCVMLLCACTQVGEQSSTNEMSEASSNEDAPFNESAPEDISNETSQESEENTVKDYPTVTGTFVQLWAFSSYTVQQWETHFNHLKDVGIDTVIVQWTATTPYGQFKDCYYGTDLAAGNAASDYVCYSSCIYRMFEAAKYTGTKIFLGLNISDEWWNYSTLDTSWGVTQATLGVNIARELYDKYYSEYSESFAGWYWSWELYNQMGGDLAVTAAQFINLYMEGLTAIDPSLPLMLSPFITNQVSAGITEATWKKFFENASFREGDIFCCQDSVGAGHILLEQTDEYFAAMAKAVATEKGLVFWANNESFNSDYTPADLSRFISQMEITDKYVSGHITFAYSHYYHPDKYPSYHQQYKDYYEDGKLG